MTFTYRFIHEPDMLELVGEGYGTQTERLETMRAMLSDPAFRPGIPLLCDFSAVSSPPTMRELRRIVDFIEQHSARIGRQKLAIVAAKPSMFGVARQFQALSEIGLLYVQVFSSRDSALAWLLSEQARTSAASFDRS
jgi:hypothetical protein